MPSWEDGSERYLAEYRGETVYDRGAGDGPLPLEGDEMEAARETTRQAFALGFHETRMGRGLNTARKVAAEHPELTADEIRIYLNGAEDAQRGDSWRMERSGYF